MAKVRKIKVKLGDVCQIPLPNGKYAYGRVCISPVIAFYNKITDEPNCPPIGLRDFKFIVGVYLDILERKKWEIIGNDPFENEEEAEPPKRFIYDTIGKKYKLYYKGEITPSTREECLGLESASVWDMNHIIDRLMGDDTWTNICK